MKERSARFWKWGLLQILILVVFLGWRFYFGTSAYLAHPNDDDLYAHTWSFQGIVFCIFRLLPALVCMSFVLGIEWLVVRKVPGRESP
jgi:hypothetical protein